MLYFSPPREREISFFFCVTCYLDFSFAWMREFKGLMGGPFIVLVVLNLLFKFWDIFTTFDHLVKDMQVVRVILARESQTKPREMWEKKYIKDDTWVG
jgi:hypothetical protein